MQTKTPYSPRIYNKEKLQAEDSLIQTIDHILEHHYFQAKLQQMIEKARIHTDHNSVAGLLDDQYYKTEDDLVEQIANIVNETVQAKLRHVLTKEFINIGDEIEAMKQDMFTFMNQQAQKSDQIKSQIYKLADQVKRKINTTQAMSSTSVVNSGGYTGGIRFVRSSGITSSIQSANNSNTSTSTNIENKSFHSQLMFLKKQFQQLKESVQNGQSLKLLQQQFNQFKIETKVSIEALKQQTKKLVVDFGAFTKTSSSTLAPNIKEHIDASVKRTITAQQKVYSSYSEQILQMKHQIEQFENKLSNHGEFHNVYLTNQLKSVWLVLNDMKKNVDDIIEHIGLNSSREIL